MKLKITTHSGDQDIVEVEGYDARETSKEVNSSQDEHTIAFGNNIYSKIDIKSVKPLAEEEPEEEAFE